MHSSSLGVRPGGFLCRHKINNFIFPWATWCYAAHPLLWHPMGHISLETGVQQGDSLGPLLLALVQQKILNAIDADDDCVHILYQAQYLDDGTLAGKKYAILCAVSLLDSIGPSLGIFINMPKCELFCKGDTSEFPLSMKPSHVPHLDLLGAPIGDYFLWKICSIKALRGLEVVFQTGRSRGIGPLGCLDSALVVWELLN